MSSKQRLDKVLSNLGFGTRKEVKELIRAGAVSVAGLVAGDPGQQVDAEKQEIAVNGKKISYREYIYIMLNKPQGVVSATEDTREETVLDLLPDELRAFQPAPVGRLDKDTEGLLLLTNDGQLAHRLLSPRKHVAKKYIARVEGYVSENDVEEFKRGVVLDDGYKTLPAELSILEKGSISLTEIIIYEGKYHQIKRMFKAVEKTVIYLKRISMGSLILDENLELGEFRELTDKELELLRQD